VWPGGPDPHYVSSPPAGRQLAERMSEHLTKQKKEPQMDHLEQLKSFAKQRGGAMTISKHMIEKNRTYLTSNEYYEVLMEAPQIGKAR
jgi:hypothetical protein